MNVTDLQRLYDYGYWANRRLLRVISELSPDEFTRTAAGNPRSIRDTLVHAMSAEWGWLSRCGGPERGLALNPTDYPTTAAVRETWRVVEGHLRTFLSQLKDEDLARETEFTNPRGEKRSLTMAELLQHAANHGVHHRAQLALLVRLLGHTPASLDMLIYDGEQRGVSVW
jgi:uncharacterized damage-inducible protein DinB